MSDFNVIKAGGTSCGTPQAMETIINEVRRSHEKSLLENPKATTILIVSGSGRQGDGDLNRKNTDLLEDIILRGENSSQYIQSIREREGQNVSYFGLDPQLNDPYFDLLTSYLSHEGLTKDQRYSLVATSVGEILKSFQFKWAFDKILPKVATHVPFDRTGVVTTGGIRNATKTGKTYNEIKDALSVSKYKGKILVLGGFMGYDNVTNELTTLERGGSDTVALWIAAALNADRVTIFSDTSLRTADPRIVDSTQIVASACYEELEEFIGYGSQIVAERANLAAKESLIKMRLRNTFKLTEPETVIGPSTYNGYSIIKGVVARSSVVLAMHNIPSDPGTLYEAIKVLKRNHIGLTNESGDFRNSSMVIFGTPEHPLERRLQRAISEIEHLKLNLDVKYDETRIGLVGEHIGDNTKGLLAMAKTMDLLGLHPKAISQAYEGNALSVITQHLPQESIHKAIRTLHHQVFET